MDVVLSNGFVSLSETDTQCIDGGANVVQAIGGTLGAAAVCWTPVLALAGFSPLAVVGVALVGVGAFINMAAS